MISVPNQPGSETQVHLVSRQTVFAKGFPKMGWVGWLVGSLLPGFFCATKRNAGIFLIKYLEGDS